MEIKIFENNTVVNCWKELKSQGFKPATLKEIFDLRKANKIPKDQGYDCGTCYLNGNIKSFNGDIEKLYVKGGRVLFVGNYDNFDLYGNGSLDNSGRFVGVKK